MNQSKSKMNTGFTVIMPTYNQCSFIRRAVSSLFRQTFKEWELIIINDGCTDETEEFLKDYLTCPSIRYLKNTCNSGLGYSLNIGLDHATFEHIAYLPSDDFFYEYHLQSLFEQFEKHPDTVLAVNGIKYDNSDSMYPTAYCQSNYAVPDHCLQLVQCAHRLTDERWVERRELVTDDLFTMFWNKLVVKGLFSFTGSVACHWTSHPEQRHKKICEKLGGSVHAYRSYYGVREPLKIKVSPYKLMDENKQYEMFNQKIGHKKKMKVLLVGELAYNAERIIALETFGCELYGLWIQNPNNYTTVGPLPFGNVVDVPFENRISVIHQIKPDIIYAQLNSIVVPLAYEVLQHKGDIPMVWHFKEGPFVCMKRNLWKKLTDLYYCCEGKIYINPEIKLWYETFIPYNDGLSCILDGDLPPKAYFNDHFSPKLSAVDGEFHTVTPGRVVGIYPDTMRQLADNNIHVHLYTDTIQNRRDEFIRVMKAAAPLHFHLHPFCEPKNWVEEFSRYDAGWLHSFESDNCGDLTRATWDDLNMPARMNTLAAAGLPMIQYDNTGHIVATQEYLKKINAGLFYKEAQGLREQLADRQLMDTLNRNMLKNRFLFCFNEYVPALIDFFKLVIDKTKKR